MIYVLRNKNHTQQQFCLAFRITSGAVFFYKESPPFAALAVFLFFLQITEINWLVVQSSELHVHALLTVSLGCDDL